jgi:hypothetical protein
MVEMSISESFNNIVGIKCIDLDKSHKIGSEYKNDISILNLKFSIKTKLNKGGNVILINKKSNNVKHNTSVNLILCVINEEKLYIFPDNFIPNIGFYIKHNVGTIEYKSSLFTLINRQYKMFIYTFPKLDRIHKQQLEKLTIVDIFEEMYNKYIKLIFSYIF